MPLPPNKRSRHVVRYEAQPTRMFASYSITAHYDDGSCEAVGYGEPRYCLTEAERRNAEIAAVRLEERKSASAHPIEP
jgi:hypothetical protein